MTGAQQLGEVVAFLAARYELGAVDEATGRFQVAADGASVSVELSPALVPEYLAQLDDGAVPGLAAAPPEQQARLRARALARSIGELVDADIFGSLRGLLIERKRGGELWLKDVRGPRTRSLPDPGPGAYWTAERPGD